MTQLPADILPLDDEYFVSRRLQPAEQRFFRSNAFVHIDGLWTSRLSTALAEEASAQHAVAKVPPVGPRTMVEESRSARRPTTAATGELLSRLHLSLIGVVRALSGRLLVPTFSAYGYYEQNDETLLHLDSDQCDLTLLTTAIGRVGSLRLHPELRGLTMEELGKLERDPAWDRMGGRPIDYPTFGVTALAGNIMPHHRPGQNLSHQSAVAALCYRALW
jgi:hypothetical protein